MNAAQLRALRDRLYLQEEIPDDALQADDPPFFSPKKTASNTST